MAEPVNDLSRALRTTGSVRAFLDEPVTDEFAQRMASWWQQSQANREPSPKVDPALFGLDLDGIRPRFAEYVSAAERWMRHPGQGA